MLVRYGGCFVSMTTTPPTSPTDVLCLRYAPLDVKKGIPQGSGVYFITDENGTIQYVGQSGSIRSRISGHNRAADFLTVEATRVHWLLCAETDARFIEDECIGWFDPLLNRTISVWARDQQTGREIAQVMLSFYGIPVEETLRELGIAEQTTRG